MSLLGGEASLGRFWKCFWIALIAAVIAWWFLLKDLPHSWLTTLIVFILVYAGMTTKVR